jgi:ABC-type uncharacterized transport system involved in gliding motility auxiliary subunit
MKNIIIYWQYLKHGVWLGIVLLIMGITAGVVSGDWIPVPVGLIIAGAGVVGIWLVVSGLVADQVVQAGEQGEVRGDRASWATLGRNFNYLNGGNALVATISVVVILLLVNFLAFRYSLRLDLTENQIFSLSPQSQAVVQKLQQPVKIWVFENNPNPADRELLENYRRQGTEFSYEFVDPELRLSVAEQFKVQSIGEVHIEAGTRRKLLQVVNDQQRLSESSITNGIELIQSNRTPKVYFLQGHGEASLTATERGLSQLNEALGQKNYEVSPLTLAAATAIPPEAEIIVIAGAKRNLLPEEAQALKTYLEAGGNLLILLEARTSTGLDELFRDWGIVLDNRVAIDGSGNGRLIGLGAATSLVTTYGNHPITKDLGTGISLFPLARSIELQPVTGVTQTPLVITNEKSWAEANPEQQPLVFDQATDKLGPLNLAVALSRPAPSSSAKESRLVIFGNATFATNGWFEQQLNGDLILNAIGWLGQQDNQALSIRPKSAANRRIILNPFQYLLLGWTALVIIPLVGFTTAGVLWWRRR